MKPGNRSVAIGSLALLTAVSLVGCASGTTPGAGTGSTAGSTAGSTDEAASTKSGKVTIEFALGKSSENAAYANPALLAEFEKQTNIHVNIQMLPSEQISTIMQTKLAVGEVPDLILYNLVSAERELNLSKNFEVLDQEPWASRLMNKEVLSSGGHIYAFHLNQDAGQQGMVYNEDIFKELGLSVPKNYTELLDVCEKIKAKGITPIFMPFKDSWATNIWTAAALADYAKKNDPKLWEDLTTNKRKWTEIPAFETITQQQLDLFKKGYTNKDVLSDSYDMAVGKFLKKEVAMMAMGDWLINDAYQKDPNLHLGLFAIPYADGADLGISPLGGQLFVPKKAKHLAETKKFLDYLASQSVGQQIVTANKYISNFKDIQTPELPPYKQAIVATYLKTNRTTMTMDAYLPVDISELWKGYQDMYAGGKTAKEVYAAWDKKFGLLMKDKKMPGF
ncbi:MULTISPECIES: ABC transporter substrate-binding protein [Paenibacillus]|uniref:ABC transporter substrate-binding protein n=1 Tax=Paenibacillus TaxID=44249 RepID=UPI0022B86EEC|nr:ABC transporter substrate-binding protein [Paenibacillus caseinilyticus]MCZ8521647.1 ABC transporter substrate-binding protein [Paenibacillus caseinilyticus]